MNLLRQKLQTLKPEELLALYHKVFDNPEGQLVIEDLKCRAFHYDTTKGATDSDTNINEGARRLLLHILTMVETTIESDSVSPEQDS